MAKPDMDQPRGGRRDSEMDDMPEERNPPAPENIRGVGEEERGIAEEDDEEFDDDDDDLGEEDVDDESDR
jgi:hypothetical protein